jgi:hypothetical protein
MGANRFGGLLLPDILHFLLVPDKASGRIVRRALAVDGARFGTVVGTWGELVDQAGRAYLLALPATGWDERLEEAARKLPDAFWSESLKADPEGTVATVGRELRRLLEALGPGKEIQPSGKSPLSARGKRHLSDLSRLHAAMGRILPEDLAAVAALLSADKTDATRRIAVTRKEWFPPLSPWQEALLAKLEADSGSSRDPGLEAILGMALSPVPAGRAKSALRHMQESLFVGGASQSGLDETVACLAVRDRLEAAEVAAGMVQKVLGADRKLSASSIALLVPADGSCDDAVREVFSRAGLPLSGLADPFRLRNLGGEAVFHFLATRRRPAPAMALSALYSSPLMPWDGTAGNRLAMEVMDGEYDPETPGDFSQPARKMMDLLRGRHETPKALGDALKAFRSLLSPSDPVARHAEAARSAVDSLLEALRSAKGKDVPWEELAALVPQAPFPSDAPAEVTREGVAVFREDEEPWRRVRVLYVLGFSEGRYPSGPARSPVFDPADTASLKERLGYALETTEEGLARRRGLLLRQLRAACGRAVFLSPLRDEMGEAIAPSGTLSFMARLFDGIQAPEEVLLTLERESDRGKIEGLPLAPATGPEWPRTVEIRDPQLSADLITDSGGKLRPLTPSGLETLMVSPLGWLLERFGVSPLSWAPEELDPATKGTLAHEVFEKLFLAGAPLPGAAKVKTAVERLLTDAILGRAPFLLGSEWYVERRNLLKEIETAAVRWRELLDRSGARILGVETSLEGVFEGVPIRGRSDLLLSLPSGHIFVVDYKKSASSARRRCMEKGYDIQTSLYRHMLRSGGVLAGGGEALAAALKDGAEIGVLYYMMDDQRALTDTSGWIPRTVSGVQELGGGISANGEELVRERMRALRSGRVPLNREDDEENFRKVGVKTYAVEKSPLIRRFMHPAPEGEDRE